MMLQCRQPLGAQVLLQRANAFAVSAATGAAPVASGLATMIGAVGAGLFDVTSRGPVSAEEHHFFGRYSGLFYMI